MQSGKNSGVFREDSKEIAEHPADQSMPPEISQPQPIPRAAAPSSPVEQARFEVPLRAAIPQNTPPVFAPKPPRQEEKPAQAKAPLASPGIPNPFGTDNFYPEQPSFENVGEELNKKAKESSGKSSRKLTGILMALLVLLLAGGGFYYWWFYMHVQNTASKPNASSNAKTPAPTPAPGATAANQNGQASQPPSQAANGKVREWALDTSSDKIAAKLAIKRYISDFVASAQEGDLAEAKIVSSSNASVPPDKFEELFDFQMPQDISSGLTGEYSIFTKKENGVPRLGGVFQLSNTASIAAALQGEESALPTELKSFYLDAVLPSDPPAFSSSIYNGADIRYFNFSSPADTSFDYSVVSGQGNNFFIFATSKDTLRSILDYMSAK